MSEIEAEFEALLGKPMPVTVTNPKEIAYAHFHNQQTSVTLRTTVIAPGEVQMIVDYSPTRIRTQVWPVFLGASNSGVFVAHSNNAAQSCAKTTIASLPNAASGVFFPNNAAMPYVPVDMNSQTQLYAACPSDSANSIMVNIIEEYELSAGTGSE